MDVKIGSARIDENGNATGGKAGDQNKKEVSRQNWYRHTKGWRVLRCRDAAKAGKIAAAMNAACDNDHVGYDQSQRLTLYNAAKQVDFDIGKIQVDCETDCSALVRVCCAYAGITVGNFRTPNEASMLLGTGEFIEATGSEYTDSQDLLRTGDILVTRTQGHTVVVLSDGVKAGMQPSTTSERCLLRNGSAGSDVQEMQSILINLGYDCGSWGADGDFGDCTERAVRSFQRSTGCKVDGICGSETWGMLDKLSAENDAIPEQKEIAEKVEIIGGNCYVREKASTDGKIINVAYRGQKLEYGGETSPNGWHSVVIKGKKGWVSYKYSRLV